MYYVRATEGESLVGTGETHKISRLLEYYSEKQSPSLLKD